MIQSSLELKTSLVFRNSYHYYFDKTNIYQRARLKKLRLALKKLNSSLPRVKTLSNDENHFRKDKLSPNSSKYTYLDVSLSSSSSTETKLRENDSVSSFSSSCSLLSNDICLSTRSTSTQTNIDDTLLRLLIGFTEENLDLFKEYSYSQESKKMNKSQILKSSLDNEYKNENKFCLKPLKEELSDLFKFSESQSLHEIKSFLNTQKSISVDIPTENEKMVRFLLNSLKYYQRSIDSVKDEKEKTFEENRKINTSQTANIQLNINEYKLDHLESYLKQQKTSDQVKPDLCGDNVALETGSSNKSIKSKVFKPVFQDNDLFLAELKSTLEKRNKSKKLIEN